MTDVGIRIRLDAVPAVAPDRPRGGGSIVGSVADDDVQHVGRLHQRLQRLLTAHAHQVDPVGFQQPHAHLRMDVSFIGSCGISLKSRRILL